MQIWFQIVIYNLYFTLNLTEIPVIKLVGLVRFGLKNFWSCWNPVEVCITFHSNMRPSPIKLKSYLLLFKAAKISPATESEQHPSTTAPKHHYDHRWDHKYTITTTNTKICCHTHCQLQLSCFHTITVTPIHCILYTY